MSTDSINNFTDDFLKENENTEFLKDQTRNYSPESSIKNNDIKSIVPPETINSDPDLIGTDFPSEYITIVNRIKAQYKLLPVLNYDNIYHEISDLSIKSSPTPTLEILNDELYKVQAAKDRLAEILIDVIKCYNFKKRAVDILRDAWGKFSPEKNAEGRKGDATFRLSFFLADFAQTEALSKSCDHILKNLDSLQDNLSRRITIWQLLLKLREGRMALPDHDFDKAMEETKIDDLFRSQKEGGNEDNSIKLREF
jgi:hypothetical protein